MPNAHKAAGEDGVAPHDRDRYPTLKEVLAKVNAEVAVGDLRIERLELTALANGDCTYRFWTPRAEEPEGGIFPG